jgi:hypothetical protein
MAEAFYAVVCVHVALAPVGVEPHQAHGRVADTFCIIYCFPEAERLLKQALGLGTVPTKSIREAQPEAEQRQAAPVVEGLEAGPVGFHQRNQPFEVLLIVIHARPVHQHVSQNGVIGTARCGLDALDHLAKARVGFHQRIDA